MNTKKILNFMGVAFVVAGLVGFALPHHHFLGMHLTLAHNLVHLLTGGMALYFAHKGTLHSARSFSVVFGITYALLGVIGLVAGGVDRMLVIIPNQLMFGTADNVFHIMVGFIFLAAGLARKSVAAAY